MVKVQRFLWLLGAYRWLKKEWRLQTACSDVMHINKYIRYIHIINKRNVSTKGGKLKKAIIGADWENIRTLIGNGSAANGRRIKCCVECYLIYTNVHLNGWKVPRWRQEGLSCLFAWGNSLAIDILNTTRSSKHEPRTTNKEHVACQMFRVHFQFLQSKFTIYSLR